MTPIPQSPPSSPSSTKVDYYKSLGVSRTATLSEIKKAYRKIAIRYHPDKVISTDDNKQSELKFVAATEAYEVLCDHEKRAAYNKYGAVESPSKKGKPDANSIFAKFFGEGQNSNPFGKLDLTDVKFESQLDEMLSKNKPEPIRAFVECNLGDFCNKKITKYLSLKRQRRKFVMGAEQEEDSLKEEDVLLEVHVPLGAKDGQEILLKGEGDQIKNQMNTFSDPGDVVVTVKVIPHAKYSMKGFDLYYRHNITLADALTGNVNVELPAIDESSKNNHDSKIVVQCKGIIHPEYERRVKFQGLPLSSDGVGCEGGETSKRGDVVLTFNIVFPLYLNRKSKQVIRNELEGELIDRVHQ